MKTLLPDLLYRDDAFHAGLALQFDEDSGRIIRVVPANELNEATEVMRLAGRALMPGFINCHSHSFQRLIRGRTQWKPAGAGASDFWSWRESMYSAVLTIEPDALYDVSRFCFMEMLRAGYTTVGEFHYVHRDPAGNAYNDRNELAHRITAAAESVGIRMCLLNVCYATGAINEPLRAEQRRFATPDLDGFLGNTQALLDGAAGSAMLTVGVAPHSVRAVPRDWISEIGEYAYARRLPIHMHVSEQPAEVDACVQQYGVRPGEMLERDNVLSPDFTAVHGTHLAADEIAMFGRSRANICLCPTTERDLGDGLARIDDMRQQRVNLCIGTDSQTVIDPLEEIRLIEYNERLRLLRRVVVAGQRGTDAVVDTPHVLLSAGSTGGARSLRLDTGLLEPDMHADFVGIDLDHTSLAGWTPSSLAALVALSAPASIIRDVWVNGVRRVGDGVHGAEDEIVRAYRDVTSAQGW